MSVYGVHSENWRTQSAASTVRNSLDSGAKADIARVPGRAMSGSGRLLGFTAERN